MAKRQKPILKYAEEEAARMFVATRAFSATGMYPLQGYSWEWRMPEGVQIVDGPDNIQSATTVAAALLDRADDFGAIEPGKYGDIIAVSGDPLASINELERVRFVMKGGEVYRNDGIAGVSPAMSAQREECNTRTSRLTARCGRDARDPI